MVLLPLLLWALASQPADGLLNPVHRSWGVTEGLPQSSVHALVQDGTGWLYAGTQEGLARFDGDSWQAIASGSKQPRCRPVRALAQGDHRVWVGTLNCGLSVLEDGVVRQVPGFDSSPVIDLEVQPDGLWIATGGGIFRRSPEGRVETLLQGDVSALRVVQDGYWVAIGGQLRFVPKTGAPREVPELSGKPITALVSAGDTLWVGTANAGLYRVRDGHAERSVGPLTVSALMVDREGMLWVGDRDGGLFRGDEKGLEPVRGFDGVPTHTLLQDREGSIWVGTSGRGLHQLRPAQILNFGEDEGLHNPVSWSVAQDARGTVWIGTENGRLVHLEHGRPQVSELPAPLAGAAIFDISIARDGTIWLATRKGYAVKRGETIRVLGDADGLPHVAGTILARRDGSVWAGNGLGLFCSSGGRFERLQVVPKGVHVFGLRETSDGALWAGTTSGVYRLEDGAVRRFSAQDGLGGDRILEVSEDADRPGAVWVGGSNGISLIDHGTVHTLRGDQGLTDELVFAIVDDGQGRLWLGTDRGILRLKKAQAAALFAGRISQVEPDDFGVADGMRNPECNGYSTASSMLARDGEVWFATMGGAVHFHPDKLQPSHPTAPATIVSAQSNGHPLLAGEAISASDPNVEIRYVAPTFLDPIRLRYRYRLDGFDDDWVDVGTRKYALYTNLPPGRYTFRVQAFVPGQWASTEARLSFVRPSRLPEHWAFYPAIALLVLALLGAAAFVHFRRLEQRVRSRTRELSEALDRVAQSERSVRIAERMASIGTLAAGVAHEINNPLAYLCSNVDFALEELRDASSPLFLDRVQEIVAALTEASDGAKRVKNIVKDLKTFSRAENGPPGLVDLREVFETSLNLARNTVTQRAKLTVDFQPVPPVRGDGGRLAQVLVNLVVNAAQAIAPGAADKNEITVRCGTSENGAAFAEVRDTGSGIPKENLARIFDPFFTTKPVGVGTGLGLSICHGIVSELGGRIEVESEVGRGTRFFVQLPAEPTETQATEPEPSARRSMLATPRLGIPRAALGGGRPA